MLFDPSFTPASPDSAARVFAHALPPHRALGTADLMRRIQVPLRRRSQEAAECDGIRDLARALVRQDDWEEIARLVIRAEARRAVTAGGRSIAALLAEGAREDAVLPGIVGPGAALGPDEAMDMLEQALGDHPDSWPVAAIVALAHIDVGWAWRGDGWTEDVPPLHLARFANHLARAAAILDGFDPFTTDAPLLAAARCALLTGREMPEDRVADDFEDLIDLDPRNPTHMKALGVALLPRWSGSYARLEREARRTADRTRDIWGTGGYAWVCFHAICVDDGVLEFVDPDLFLGAVADILDHRGDAHTANLWAGFLAVTLRGRSQRGRLGPRAIESRARIAAGLGFVVHHHLHEVHPLVWAEAAQRFVPRPGPVSARRAEARGRDLAMHALARVFATEVDAGLTVTLTPEGPRLG